jgi:3-(3-hydroxy-phenyl)propionate hydroxylase
MTGGTRRTARLRRAALRTVSRLPGVERRALDAAWPPFLAGPLVSRGDPAAGQMCPRPRLETSEAQTETHLDQVAGDGFAIITRRGDGTSAYDPRTRAFFDAIGTTVVPLGDPASATDLDGTLTALLDRVIAACADRADLRAWRRLLEAAGITAAGEGQPA